MRFGLQLPDSHTNYWCHSWKRFFLDFMVYEGLTMLYPNLPEQRSFSTSYAELGRTEGWENFTTLNQLRTSYSQVQLVACARA